MWKADKNVTCTYKETYSVTYYQILFQRREVSF